MREKSTSKQTSSQEILQRPLEVGFQVCLGQQILEILGREDRIDLTQLRRILRDVTCLQRVYHERMETACAPPRPQQASGNRRTRGGVWIVHSSGEGRQSEKRVIGPALRAKSWKLMEKERINEITVTDGVGPLASSAFPRFFLRSCSHGDDPCMCLGIGFNFFDSSQLRDQVRHDSGEWGPKPLGDAIRDDRLTSSAHRLVWSGSRNWSTAVRSPSP